MEVRAAVDEIEAASAFLLPEWGFSACTHAAMADERDHPRRNQATTRGCAALDTLNETATQFQVKSKDAVGFLNVSMYGEVIVSCFFVLEFNEEKIFELKTIRHQQIMDRWMSNPLHLKV